MALTPMPVCAQVMCGRRPCLLQRTLGQERHQCPAGQECQEHNFLTCFSPPCHQWGICSSADPPPPINTKCEPNTGYLDNSCARITLIFNRNKVPLVRALMCPLSVFEIHSTLSPVTVSPLSVAAKFCNGPNCLSLEIHSTTE